MDGGYDHSLMLKLPRPVGQLLRQHNQHDNNPDVAYASVDDGGLGDGMGLGLSMGDSTGGKSSPVLSISSSNLITTNTHNHNNNNINDSSSSPNASAAAEVNSGIRHRSASVIRTEDLTFTSGKTGYKYISKTQNQDDLVTLKKRFLFRLLYELQTSGNFGYRTEKFIHRVGRVYNLYVVCGVYPRTATVTFQHDHSESYTFELSSAYHIHKLELLDELFFDIYSKHLPFDTALVRLAEIEKTGSYSPLVNLAAFAVASSTSTVMFFGGTWLDGLWSFVMGIIVYYLNIICSRFSGLLEIEVFISSFTIACITSMLDLLVYSDNLCLYGVLFGGVVWLLPGVSITVSFIELYSKMITYGSSKLVYSISLASQIGFGLTLGYKVGKLSDGIPYSFIHGCRSPVSAYYDFILLPLCGVSFSVLLKGSSGQHFGVCLICGIGVAISLLLSRLNMGQDAIPFLSALLVTASARLYTHYFLKGKRPLVYIISGLLVLVPGGVAVRGMSSIWQDASTGLEFTVKMLMIGVSLAIGVFVALLPPFQRVDKEDQEYFDGRQYEAALNPLQAESV